MLKPGDREHLINMLKPPPGCKLDFAVGTTFSLDLTSALMLPLSFAFCDWQKPDGQLKADPLALLEALRRYGERYAVFCQSGQIRLPKKYDRLVSFLEPCVYDVQSKDEKGVFHPKVWALRFVDRDGAVKYRVLCLSRNLTFDRSWDTAVVLDGNLKNRQNAIAANHPLGDFVSVLPSLSLRPVTAEHRKAIRTVADELRRVEFDLPDGFESYKFWAGGLDGRATSPFQLTNAKSLLISPFVTSTIVDEITAGSSETHLVSRVETLDALPAETLQKCASVRYLATELESETGIEDDDAKAPADDALDGLHAKLFIIDQGWNSNVFSGSFNATRHAFEHNVEFMVQLVGKRSAVGVERMLGQVNDETLFADLLQPYITTRPDVPIDRVLEHLEELIQKTKRLLSSTGGKVIVKSLQGADQFDVDIAWKREPRLPTGVEVRVWPITLAPDAAQDVKASRHFSGLSFEALTPWIAFAITASEGDKKLAGNFVLNLPIEGAPEDRLDRIIQNLVGSREQLLRYILFLLAAGDEDALSSGHLQQLIRDEPGATTAAEQVQTQLFETMLRSLHRTPDQLGRVEELLKVLRKRSAGSAFLSPEFKEIWEPIWEAARQAGAQR